MRVEMYDTDGTVRAVDASKQGQRNGVVTTEGNDTREGRAFEGGAFLVGVRSWRPREDAVVAFFDLVDSVGVVISQRSSIVCSQPDRSYLRGNRDISAVQHRSPAIERIGVQGYIVPTTETNLT